LRRKDADTNLLFLTNFNLYSGPVYDPWFSAHEGSAFTSTDHALYQPNRLVSVLGCIEQHQYCNVNLPSAVGCTTLNGLDELQQDLSNLKLNEQQSLTLQHLFKATSNNTLSMLLSSLGSSSLLAENSRTYALSAPLPSNQWHLEVTNWFDIMMARLKSQVVGYVTGPSNPGDVHYLEKPSTPEEQSMCMDQKVIRTDYASFSIFGLTMILVLGSLIIVINLTLETLAGAIQKRTSKGEYRQLEWGLTETLQLQRLAYEGRDIGTWKGAVNEIPVTAYGESFGVLEMSETDPSKADSQRESLTQTENISLVSLNNRQ